MNYFQGTILCTASGFADLLCAVCSYISWCVLVAGWCINAVLLAVLKVTLLDGFIISSGYRS